MCAASAATRCLTMPVARSLVSRPAHRLTVLQSGIMESEPFGLPFRTVDSWKGFAKTFAADAGCTDPNYDACLQSKTSDEIIAAQVRWCGRGSRDVAGSGTLLRAANAEWLAGRR